ncbi:MAG: hypothetical protein HZA14_10075 [Nitrospirae bacterium]|nr:hypothetical protein [Nitrospirota bacterium]
MKKRMVVLIAALLFIFPAIIHAEDNTGSNSVSLKLSTLGAGLEVEGPFSDSISGRLGINYFPYNYDGTADDIDYEYDLTLLSLSALLDWHPFQGSFRISGGVLYNGNKIDAEATSAATYDIGDRTFTGSDVGNLKGDIDFQKLSPYLGLGWDTSFGKKERFGFLVELGVIYQGSPKVGLSADGPISDTQIFQNELSKEEDNMQEDIKGYKYYPVIGVGVSYRF